MGDLIEQILGWIFCVWDRGETADIKKKKLTQLKVAGSCKSLGQDYE